MRKQREGGKGREGKSMRREKLQKGENKQVCLYKSISL